MGKFVIISSPQSSAKLCKKLTILIMPSSLFGHMLSQSTLQTSANTVKVKKNNLESNQ